LRDAQAYVQAAGSGQGIFELPYHRVKADIAFWQPLIAWLDAEAVNTQQASSSNSVVKI